MVSALSTLGLLLFLFSENSVERKSRPCISFKFFTSDIKSMNKSCSVKLKHLRIDFKMGIIPVHSRKALKNLFEYLDIQYNFYTCKTDLLTFSNVSPLLIPKCLLPGFMLLCKITSVMSCSFMLLKLFL